MLVDECVDDGLNVNVMVTRSDPKPLYYYSTALKTLRPVVNVNEPEFFEALISKLISIKELSPYSFLIPEKMRIIESDTFASDMIYDIIEQECSNSVDPYMSVNCTAAFMSKHYRGRRGMLFDKALCANVTNAYKAIFSEVSSIYHGSEAAVMLFDRIIHDKFVLFKQSTKEIRWAQLSALNALLLQSPSCMQNPEGMYALCHDQIVLNESDVTSAFTLFATAEKVLYRSNNKHNYLSHLHFSNRKVTNFTPKDKVEENFDVTLKDMVATDVKVYKILGNTIVRIGSVAFLLSNDDVISVIKMIRAYANGAMYFAFRRNDGGVFVSTFFNSVSIMLDEIKRMINNKVDYGKFLRACNLYNMVLFNELEETNDRIKYKERSQKLMDEIHSLCPTFRNFEECIDRLSHNKYDKLNVVYLYHMIVGIDAGVDDLIEKLKASEKKPNETKYDKDYLKSFFKFLNSYKIGRAHV